MTEHPDLATIERFAIGSMEPEDDFVTHLSSCKECAEKLAREARLELALADVQALRKEPHAHGKSWRTRSWVFPTLVFAAAAAVLFAVRRQPAIRDAGEVRADPVVETPSVTDTPPANADAVVAGLRPLFRDCYQAGLAQDPSMSGKAVIGASVGPNGDVQSAFLVSGEGLSTGVTGCLVQVVRGAHFAATGGSSTMRIPVTFLQRK